MKIEKIELNGFKSFSDRTIFNLHSGITGIVGPNGCGKSNIVDAFRWVLGEQSAKTLRGDKMEEVIFNGSAARKPKGMAEVTLHISGLGSAAGGNGGGDKLVTVSRRLYRSGESEYLINRNTCRLKDIRDLFLDTGLEVKSYSIIEQGRIGDILNSKPADRRFLIEEVAGVMKYKVRKAEAKNKLESSRQNLQRIVDIVAEVKKQIKTLDRLARKAEKYKELAEELKVIDLKINRKEYVRLRDSLASTESEFRTAREQDSSLRATMSTLEADFQTERIALVEKEKELNALLERFQEHERAVAEMQKSIAVLKTEEENARQHASRTRDRITEYEERIVLLNQRLQTLEEEQQRYTLQIEEITESVSEKKEVLSGIENEMNDLETALEDRRKDIFRLADTISTLNTDLTRCQSAVESMAKKEEGQLREIDEMTTAMDQLEQDISAHDARVVEKNSDLSMHRSRKETLEAGLAETRQLIERLRGEISSLKEEIASDNSRLSSLKEITSEALTMEILAEAEKFHVRGALSDILSVDTRYEKALETVLSERINGFVLSSVEDIESAASFIKEKGLARTALMYDTGARKERSALEANDQVIGHALDFVQVQEGFRQITDLLLSDVVIVSSIHSAFALKERYPGYTFVTPGGDMLDDTYTLFSGEGKGILTRKREIRELSDRTSARQENLAASERRLEEAQATRERTEADITATAERTAETEKELSGLRYELQNMHQEKERLQKKKAFIKLEIDQAHQEKQSLLAKIADIEGSKASSTSKREDFESSLNELQRSLSEKRSVHETHRAALTDLQMQVTGLREKVDGIARETGSTSQTIAESRQKVSDLQTEVANTEEAIRAKQARAEEIDGEQKERVLQIDTLGAQIAERKEHLAGVSAALEEKEKEVRSLRNRIDELSAKVSSCEVSMTEYRLKMENLFNNTIQQYSVNIDQYHAEEPTEEELERAGPLREKIQSIGPVNLGTIEEYEELKERYEFLNTQQEDLTKSIDELEEAIRKINHTTRKRLRDAFDALNAKFGEVFAHLFNGGKAELVLTDDQNILEAGIDIIAQPPGKRLRNILQLSGGEKALTAISVVFAGFLIKPSPICILDEADAPLDDSNTDRYANLVKELSNNTQFIVITHNRTTMESAEHLYGITMEEPGTSKVISLQMTEV